MIFPLKIKQIRNKGTAIPFLRNYYLEFVETPFPLPIYNVSLGVNIKRETEKKNNTEINWMINQPIIRWGKYKWNDTVPGIKALYLAIPTCNFVVRNAL